MRRTRVRPTATLLIASFIVLLTSPAGASPWREDRPITVGHRGTTLLADENTMDSYNKAWEHGLDVIECDPRRTADGVFVVMHDPTVDRTTDGSGKVSSMTFEEIKKLRTESGHEVPTLEGVLTFAREKDLAVYLDLKDPPRDENDRDLVDLIEKTGMAGRVIMGCYELKTLKILKAQNPSLSACASWPYPAPTLKRAKNLGADAVGTLKGLASKAMVDRAHKLGLKVITMPINDADKMDKFRARGLDAIQTDDPRLINEEPVRGD